MTTHFDSGDHFKHFSGLGYKTFTKSNHSDFSQNLEIKKNILKVKSEHSQISVLRYNILKAKQSRTFLGFVFCNYKIILRVHS